MQNDYQALAIEAVELANSLSAENKRLRLSIALMKFKSKGRKVGRKEIVSDNDILTMVEFFPELQGIYKARGKRLTQIEFATLMVRNMFPEQNKFAHRGKIKTIQNRMNEMRKNPLIHGCNFGILPSVI
jgi:hypothetical protein